MGRPTFDNVSKVNSHDDSFEQQMMQSSMSDGGRIVTLHADVNEHSISSVIAQLLNLANISSKPIHLIVSTYGGSVDEMFSLYDVIRFLPCPVHTIGLGKVMSAGVLLLASGEKGKRSIGRSARIMIHPMSGGTYGNVFEIINHSAEQERLQHLMEKSIVDETDLTLAAVKKIMKAGHDFYITAEQAVKYGIVDKII